MDQRYLKYDMQLCMIHICSDLNMIFDQRVMFIESVHLPDLQQM